MFISLVFRELLSLSMKTTDRSVLGIVEALEQLNRRAFPASTWSDQSRALTRINGQRQSLENLTTKTTTTAPNVTTFSVNVVVVIIIISLKIIFDHCSVLI